MNEKSEAWSPWEHFESRSVRVNSFSKWNEVEMKWQRSYQNQDLKLSGGEPRILGIPILDVSSHVPSHIQRSTKLEDTHYPINYFGFLITRVSQGQGSWHGSTCHMYFEEFHMAGVFEVNSIPGSAFK